jgi:MYXO-CTERM domain-containing protein
MSVAAHTALVAAIFAAEPEFAIHLRDGAVEAPAPAAPPGPRDQTAAPIPDELPVAYGDDAVPMDPAILDTPHPRRKLGTNTTIFVNFDGVEIEYCNPSNSHDNCSWLETDSKFEPYSGSLAQRVAILDALRAMTSPFGVRVTGQRPPASEPYLMVVYGGEATDDEALGRAPAGDCLDDLPNQIAHVYLDGERSHWVNGGASTILHEAAHTWGFDHIGLEGALMAPAGGNTKANFFDGCAQIVENTDLDPVEQGSCPYISLEQCGLGDFQHDVAMMHMLFGEPYVDDIAPTLELVSPADGAYFQGPASFPVELRVIDDLHPQVYELAIAIEGLVDDPEFKAVHDPSFEVEALPLGEWRFDLRLRDEAGNETSLSFEVVVGEEAPEEPNEGCACTSGEQPHRRTGGRALPWLLLALALPSLRRRKPQAARALARRPLDRGPSRR